MDKASDPGKASRNQSEHAPLWRSLAGALLPNAPFVLLGCYMPLQRGAINLDYIALAAVAAWLPGTLFVCTLSLLLAVDALQTLAGSYYFSFSDAISCATDLIHVSPVFSCIVAAMFLVIIAGLAFATEAAVSRSMTRRRACLLVGIAVMLAAIDVVDGTSMFSTSQATDVRINVAGSALVRSMRQLSRYVAEVRQPKSSAPVEGATAYLLRSAVNASDENVVLIIDESFGLMLDDRGRELLVAPFRDDAVVDRYFVTQSSVNFHGSTVAGEFRELCGRDVGLRERSSNGAELSACLPALFHKAGYRTTAYHGFTSRMFERDRWYPRFGFDEQLFEEQLRDRGLDECGFAFRGICDSGIATQIADRLSSSSGREFVYWLTLNTHLPVDHELANRSNFDCSTYPPARHNSDVCDWMRVTILTHEAIARLMVDPRIPPTRFIIVGDHAPPFLAKAKRNLFSQQRVPAWTLVPRAPSIPRLVTHSALQNQRSAD